MNEDGIVNHDLWYWCDPCQFVSVVHAIPSKNRWAIKMHRASEKNLEKVSEWR